MMVISKDEMKELDSMWDHLKSATARLSDYMPFSEDPTSLYCSLGLHVQAMQKIIERLEEHLKGAARNV